MMELLTVQEGEALAELEQVIERGLTTFVDVGNALLTIRDERLYRADYATFEDYCEERWGLTRRRAYQLMDAAGAVSTMVHTGLPAPENERQARELGRVPEDQRAEVWQQTIDNTDGKPTAAAIRETYQPKPEPVADPLPEPIAEQIDQRIAERVRTPQRQPTQEEVRSAARQEALNAWNQFNDHLTAALSYARTYSPPDETDIYATVSDAHKRAHELADITSAWENPNGQ